MTDHDLWVFLVAFTLEWFTACVVFFIFLFTSFTKPKGPPPI